MITATINWVRVYPRSHRKIISITVSPTHWLLKRIMKPKDFAFNGYGHNWLLFKPGSDVQHYKVEQ